MKKIFTELKKEIQPHFKLDGSHGFDHTERVFNMAIRLATKEKADINIVGISALLHDVARSKEDKNNNICHAEEGAEMAKIILEKYNLSEDKIKNIVHCIKAHRYSKRIKPETKEAKIIQDADRLDAIGAICIARVFGYSGKRDKPFHVSSIKPKTKYSGESETSINHFFEKILKIKPEGFHTKMARNIAKKRYKFTKDFVDRFLKEWEGKI
ncbi:MAG: HD domain-containing protein [Candidatus Paceibacterota bacterium]|jgi:uncharacterized protein